MYIDFGSGESIMDRHEDGMSRDLKDRDLRRHAREGREQTSRLSQYVDRLRCEMDYRRLVLAEQLARFDIAQSILHADETSFFSASQCR